MPTNVLILLILLGVAATLVLCTLIFVVAVDRSVANRRADNEEEKEAVPESEKS